MRAHNFLRGVGCQPFVLFVEIHKPKFKEILFSVSRNPVAEELLKTSKTGDDFDDLAMTRKMVRVWNRSKLKVPTPVGPSKGDTADAQLYFNLSWNVR